LLLYFSKPDGFMKTFILHSISLSFAQGPQNKQYIACKYLKPIV
jgi:hypothetical protein